MPHFAEGAHEHIIVRITTATDLRINLSTIQTESLPASILECLLILVEEENLIESLAAARW
jgi:hypothetical protein